MGCAVEVREIECDRCGYWDVAKNFPDIWNNPERYAKVMRRFGHEEDLECNIGLGVVCPVCGNHYEFEFDSGDDKLERLVEVPDL